eukprot:Clim_evm6s252 gene=Clim_evmTU6s252
MKLTGQPMHEKLSGLDQRRRELAERYATARSADPSIAFEPGQTLPETEDSPGEDLIELARYLETVDLGEAGDQLVSSKFVRTYAYDACKISLTQRHGWVPRHGSVSQIRCLRSIFSRMATTGHTDTGEFVEWQRKSLIDDDPETPELVNMAILLCQVPEMVVYEIVNSIAQKTLVAPILCVDRDPNPLRVQRSLTFEVIAKHLGSLLQTRPQPDRGLSLFEFGFLEVYKDCVSDSTKKDLDNINSRLERMASLALTFDIRALIMFEVCPKMTMQSWADIDCGFSLLSSILCCHRVQPGVGMTRDFIQGMRSHLLTLIGRIIMQDLCSCLTGKTSNPVEREQERTRRRTLIKMVPLISGEEQTGSFVFGLTESFCEGMESRRVRAFLKQVAEVLCCLLVPNGLSVKPCPWYIIRLGQALVIDAIQDWLETGSHLHPSLAGIDWQSEAMDLSGGLQAIMRFDVSGASIVATMQSAHVDTEHLLDALLATARIPNATWHGRCIIEAFATVALRDETRRGAVFPLQLAQLIAVHATNQKVDTDATSAVLNALVEWTQDNWARTAPQKDDAELQRRRNALLETLKAVRADGMLSKETIGAVQGLVKVAGD